MLLQAWLDDRLDNESTKSLEHHLIGCDLCARMLDNFPNAPNSMREVFYWIRQQTQTTQNYEANLGSTLELPSQFPLEPLGISSETSDKSARWQKSHLLAHGGIGEVWVAIDNLFDRPVALKNLRPKVAHLPSVQRRFLREAQITAQLNHPGTVTIFDLEDNGPNSYYVMSLVQGQTLRQLIDQFHTAGWLRDDATADLFSLLGYFVSVAQTIGYANTHGILHRDIKSENVIVGQFGQVTMIDWGLAKYIDEPSLPEDREETIVAYSKSSSTTQVGTRLGTPAFMAPEQVRGNPQDLSARTDVYGLAAMLYEIVTGVPPFQGRTSEEIFAAVLSTSPLRFAEHGINAFDRLEQICQQGLKKQPLHRQTSAGEIGEQVQLWTTEQVAGQQLIAGRDNFFALTKDLMALIEDGGTLRWANPTWESMLGWSIEELRALIPYSIVHPEDREIVRDGLTRLFAGFEVERIEPRILCKDGSCRRVQWTASKIPNDTCIYLVGREVR